MSDAQGLYSIAAFRREPGLAANYAEYGSAVPGATDLGATHMIPFAGETLAVDPERADDPTLDGTGAAPPSDITARKGSGPIGGQLRWRGWERMLLCALGFEQPDDSPATLAAGAYCHLFELDDDLQDQPWIATEERASGFAAGDRKVRRGQIGVLRHVDPDVVFWDSMFSKVTIAGNPSEVTISFDCIPYGIARGSYNSGSWTLPAGATTRALFQNLAISLGLRAAGDAGLTAHRVGSFELTVDNKLIGDDQSTESGVYIEQPVRSAFREVTLKLEFPRYGSAEETILDYTDLDLELAAKLVFSGPEIASTGEDRKIGLFMSSLKYQAPKVNVDGPGPISPTYEFKAYRPLGSDIFETNHYNSIGLKKDSELVVTLHNEDSANYLTEI